MNKLGSSALIVLALAISPTSALPKPVTLSYSQKHALVIAYRMGAHYGLPLTFAAIIYVESSACKSMTGDHGLAHGCSQIHESAAFVASGVRIPAWQLDAPELQDENMALGAHYLALCVQRFGWPAGIDCFNTGLHKAAGMSRHTLARAHYTHAVLAAMEWLKQLPLSDD